jgi:type IV pilus assembly protein PilX
MKLIKPKQNGIALIVVLLILVVVSLLGIGGAQLAMMGEKGARNERDSQISRQYAEAALVDAEFDIRGLGTTSAARKDAFSSEMNFVPDCGTSGSLQGLCAQAFTGKPVWLTVPFDSTSSNPPFTTMGDQTGRALPSTGTGNGIQPALAPRYIVEVLPDSSTGTELGIEAPKKLLYRITSMGFGPRTDIQTVLQIVYRKE